MGVVMLASTRSLDARRGNGGVSYGAGDGFEGGVFRVCHTSMLDTRGKWTQAENVTDSMVGRGGIVAYVNLTSSRAGWIGGPQ